jgi:hypothetical protein
VSIRGLTVEQLEQMSGQALSSGNGTPGPDALCEMLTEQLGLTDAQLAIVGATIYGRGEDARVDVHLRGQERPLRFNRYADIGKPSALQTALMTQFAVVRTFKLLDALGIGATIHKLAEHRIEADEDESACEWGAEYLRVAPTEELNLGDQAERWRAFEAMARLEPARQAGDDKSPYGIAAHSVVLVDRETGQRLVRAGWFQAYVKREVGGVYSPVTLATQMRRVGWQRANSEGRIKATAPTDGRVLAWRFYTVPAGWESAEVPAGSPSRGGLPPHPRGLVDTPAGTRHLAEGDAGHAIDGNGNHANGNGGAP